MGVLSRFWERGVPGRGGSRRGESPGGAGGPGQAPQPARGLTTRDGRRSRRALLRSGLAAAGGALASALAGCAGRGAGGARAPAVPTPAQTVPTVVLAPWGWANNRVVQALIGETVAKFTAKHRGLRVQVVPGNGCCNPTADIASIVGGAEADVFTDNNFGAFRGGDYLLPLDPYLKRDNLSTDLWSRQQVDSFRTPRGQFALPAYFNVQIYIVNLSLLDQSGLAYPAPDWTRAEFTQLAGALTNTRGTVKRFGCGLDWGTGSAGQFSGEWVLRGFGGRLVSPGGERCLLGTPEAIAAGRWVYQEVLWPGLAGGSFANQTSALATVMCCCMAGLITTIRNSFKWDFYPNPLGPAGPAAFGGTQFYAINARTRVPDLAWEVLKWLSAEPDYQRLMAQMNLASPGLNTLWPEWEQVVQSVAPPLRGKAVHWFADAARQGYAYPFPAFRYDNVQAQAVIGRYLSALGSRQAASVAGAFTQAAAQADALETAAGQMSGQQRAALQSFPAAGPSIAKVPPGQ